MAIVLFFLLSKFSTANEELVQWLTFRPLNGASHQSPALAYEMGCCHHVNFLWAFFPQQENRSALICPNGAGGGSRSSPGCLKLYFKYYLMKFKITYDEKKLKYLKAICLL